MYYKGSIFGVITWNSTAWVAYLRDLYTRGWHRVYYRCIIF